MGALERQLAAQKARRPADPLLSLVVPVFNEEESIDIFLEQVVPLLERDRLRFEIVFVNDGSRDETLARLFNSSTRDHRIRIVNLSRNFGKEAALTAGIDHARGDVLIPMDIDLQDPPELIEPFIARWREGYDIVYGVRSARTWDTAAKRLSASWFYRVFNSMSPVRIPENVGDFRLVDRRAIEVLRQLPERNRFMKGLFAWVGFNAVGVPYERPQRAAGSSKFNLWRLWNFALDGVVSFSTVPLRAWFYVGVVIATVAVLYALFIVTRVLIFGIDTPGYASLLIAVLLMGAIQLLSLGIIGEYLGRLFLEVKGRPIYVVEGVYEEGGPQPRQD
ncbi:Glycosyltransferase involved in cell wall bisynthesis [Enhydrobacter aerosaccus]|uniref:Glycosyltransferase involved in cell wall bisynthesis n=2 Tax=Enhydrobacter aerosaccus TaxID=225324 RepID=A0A1T4TFJ8_9HYPH|nr:Glycosyltransferase involved in cell wall bisynthesis [Enhydrobacter aerosaccus]